MRPAVAAAAAAADETDGDGSVAGTSSRSSVAAPGGRLESSAATPAPSQEGTPAVPAVVSAAAPRSPAAALVPPLALPVDPALSDTTPLLPAPQLPSQASSARVVDPLTLHNLIVAALRAQESGDAAAIANVQARLQAALEGRPPPPPPPTLGATFGLFGIGGAAAFSAGAGAGGGFGGGFGFAPFAGSSVFGFATSPAAGAGAAVGRPAFGGAVPLPFALNAASPTAASAAARETSQLQAPSPEEAVAALLPEHKGEPVAALVRELLSEERERSQRLNEQLLQSMGK